MVTSNRKFELNKIRYERLRYSFIAYWIVAAVAVFSGFIPRDSKFSDLRMDFVGICAVLCLVLYVYYLIMLGLLVKAAKSSVALWIIGTILGSLIGFLVSYFKISNVAMQRGWTPLRGDYKRAIDMQEQAERNAIQGKSSNI